MSFVSSFENFKLWHKITNFVQIEQAFCRKPVACRPPCLFLLAFRRAEKGLGFTPLPEGDSGKKTMQLRCPSKTLCDSCKTPPSPFFALHTFFLTKEQKSCTKIACLFLPILLHLYHQTTI
uniref:hypothetical protein n=1 Tax=Alloprevotella sp. TaxID=1872471 RepID=UPI0040254540